MSEEQQTAPKLDPVFKEKWCSMLESGEYAQGRHCLAQYSPEGGATYCCLGIAYIASGAAAPNTVPRHAVPSRKVARRWYAATPSWEETIINPELLYEGEWRHLSALNDDKGLNFKQIAALIREQM